VNRTRQVEKVGRIREARRERTSESGKRKIKKGAFSHREPGQVKADVCGARATQPHEGRALSPTTSTAGWLYPPSFRSMTGGAGSGLSVMFPVRVWGGVMRGYDCCLALPAHAHVGIVPSAARSDGNALVIFGVFSLAADLVEVNSQYFPFPPLCRCNFGGILINC
jgi:hypothetical protein